jgi:cytidylate kinase/pantoate ligase/cytidylate kinase
MIVTIDGPAGAGKSTVAKRLARRLGFVFLDTGAMYRAVTLAALRRGLSWDDPAALVRLAGEVRIVPRDGRTWLDDEDVTDLVRTYEISNLVRYAANNPGVRAKLVELQQAAAAGKNVVTEGRDQGTVVFPQAECKIYLTAGPEERARRRMADLQAHGERVSYDDVLSKQNTRDESDRSREVGPMVAAEDAVEFVTDGLSIDEVVERLEQLVLARR